jgi:hypothetical protein
MGASDLFNLPHSEKELKKVKLCVEWAKQSDMPQDIKDLFFPKLIQALSKSFPDKALEIANLLNELEKCKALISFVSQGNE